MNNPFAIFELPVSFELNESLLNERYLNLQKSLHPDNFSQSSAQEKRLAIQKSAQINDAFQQLKDPVSRGEAIVGQYIDLQNANQRTNQDIPFLMQQMALRERLNEICTAEDFDALTGFNNEIKEIHCHILVELADTISQKNWSEAKIYIDRLRFIQKLFAEISRQEDNLLNI